MISRVCVLRGNGYIAPHVMDGFARGFQALGLEVRVVDIPIQPRISNREACELVIYLRSWKPDLFVCYGYAGMGMSDVLNDSGAPTALLFFDSPFAVAWGFYAEALARLRQPGNFHTFIWDAAYREAAANLGFPNVHPIMLAADPELFRWDPLVPDIPVSFVGRIPPPQPMTDARQEIYSANVNDFIDELLRVRTPEPAGSTLAAWQGIVCDGFREMFLDWGRPGTGELHLAIHREGTPMARLAALAGIFSPGMVTFGAAALTGAQAFPEVAYGPELARVYARSRVNVSVSSLQMERSMTNRFFDVAAAGGFLLTDWREDLPLALFNAEVAEAISYRSRAELGDKVDFYLHHESRRAELAAALREAVLARHTYQHRAAEVVAAVEGAAA